LDKPNNSKDDCAAGDESDIQPNNGIEELGCPVQQNLSAMPNVHRLVGPTQQSKRQHAKALVTVNAIETMRNRRVKKNWNTISQRFTSFSM
jgi:hypothetical protein